VNGVDVANVVSISIDDMCVAVVIAARDRIVVMVVVVVLLCGCYGRGHCCYSRRCWY